MRDMGLTKSYSAFVNTVQSYGLSNYRIADNKFIIFDALALTFFDDIYNLKKFYDYSVRHKNLDNLIALFQFKFSHFYDVKISKDNNIYEVKTHFKERFRTITYPKDDDFTHLLTVTYSFNLTPLNLLSSIFNFSSSTSASAFIFDVLVHNQMIKEKIKLGIKRFSDYVRKTIKDKLKKKIRDKQVLNSLVRKIKNKSFKYFLVYELHDSLALHVHILVKLPNFLRQKRFEEIINKLSSWFDTTKQGIDLKRLKRSKGSGSAKRYVLKYLFKQFQNDNLFYVTNKNNEKIYFINIKAFVINDFSRLISRSRNVNVGRYKKRFINKVENKENIEIKQFDLVSDEIIEKQYNEFSQYLTSFITISERFRHTNLSLFNSS
jgi:hypothetical protein